MHRFFDLVGIVVGESFYTLEVWVLVSTEGEASYLSIGILMTTWLVDMEAWSLLLCRAAKPPTHTLGIFFTWCGQWEGLLNDLDDSDPGSNEHSGTLGLWTSHRQDLQESGQRLGERERKSVQIIGSKNLNYKNVRDLERERKSVQMICSKNLNHKNVRDLERERKRANVNTCHYLSILVTAVQLMYPLSGQLRSELERTWVNLNEQWQREVVGSNSIIRTSVTWFDSWRWNDLESNCWPIYSLQPGCSPLSLAILAIALLA